ncbi:MAG TPA: hypothetical protein VF748_16750 [Candidatus Acidoferrum sp.]
MSYQKIKIDSLSKAVAPFRGAKSVKRPYRGWLRTVREALGMSLEHVGVALKLNRQSVRDFEGAEAEEKITLSSLARVAEAMGCDLVYAIVPKSGTFAKLAEQVTRQKSAAVQEKARQEATRLVRAVDHTMALEGQGTGRINERIQEETQRILKRRKR